MKLKTFVLTYKGKKLDGSEGIVANIPDYYNLYIAKYDTKYSEYKLGASRLAICPLHNDTDPSFGLINHRFLKEVKVFHCFGCGKSGDIVKLHQLIMSKFEHKELSEDEACRGIAKLFGIPIDDFEDIADDDYKTQFEASVRRMNTLRDVYTKRDFENEVTGILKRSQGTDLDLNTLNSACVRMIATSKKLYEW